MAILQGTGSPLESGFPLTSEAAQGGTLRGRGNCFETFVPVAYFLFACTVPAAYFLFAGNVPAEYSLYAGMVPSYKLFQKI